MNSFFDQQFHKEQQLLEWEKENENEIALKELLDSECILSYKQWCKEIDA